MKALFMALLALLVIHALALLGGAAWLGFTGRLSQTRVRDALAIFQPTLAQEKEAQVAQALLAEEMAVAQQEERRLEDAAQGPVTVADRLADNEQSEELTLRKIERLKEEITALQRNLKFTRDQLESERTRLEKQRAEFNQFQQERVRQAADENFQEVVSTIENLAPKQSKAIVLEMLRKGQSKEVVDLLAAMQLRKRAALLEAFKGEPEVRQAAQLIDLLRQRGVEMSAALAPTPETAS